MVKVYGPAMSLAASGTLADTMTFSRWKGRSYIRERVIPANPRSVMQVSMRAMFKFLSQQWTTLTTADKALWQNLADQIVASPFNAYMKFNQARWRNMLTPSQRPTLADGTGWGNINWTAATGGVRMVTLSFTRVAPQDHWGILIARSTTDGFNPGVDSLKTVYDCRFGADHTVVDSPLDAGTYYYRILLFEKWGRQGDAWIAQESAVVTAE